MMATWEVFLRIVTPPVVLLLLAPFADAWVVIGTGMVRDWKERGPVFRTLLMPFIGLHVATIVGAPILALGMASEAVEGLTEGFTLVWTVLCYGAFLVNVAYHYKRRSHLLDKLKW